MSRKHIALAIYIAALAPVWPWLALRASVYGLGRLYGYLDERVDAAEDTRPFCWLDDRYTAIGKRLFKWSRRA